MDEAFWERVRALVSEAMAVATVSGEDFKEHVAAVDKLVKLALLIEKRDVAGAGRATSVVHSDTLSADSLAQLEALAREEGGQ